MKLFRNISNKYLAKNVLSKCVSFTTLEKWNEMNKNQAPIVNVKLDNNTDWIQQSIIKMNNPSIELCELYIQTEKKDSDLKKLLEQLTLVKGVNESKYVAIKNTFRPPLLQIQLNQNLETNKNNLAFFDITYYEAMKRDHILEMKLRAAAVVIVIIGTHYLYKYMSS